MKSRLSIVRGRVSASARALGALCGVSILAACGGGPDDPSASAAAERKRPLAESRVAPPAAVTDLFRWAERTYPHYFPAGPVDQSAAPYVYRYYASTLNYLGVDGQDVYVLGPVSSGELLRVGSLSVADPNAHWLLGQRERVHLPRVCAFTRWLREELDRPA